MTDRSDEIEYLKACLARWICNIDSFGKRQAFWKEFQRRHGKAATAAIRQRVTREWKKKHARKK